jgi:hypothetical protein
MESSSRIPAQVLFETHGQIAGPFTIGFALFVIDARSGFDR